MITAWWLNSQTRSASYPWRRSCSSDRTRSATSAQLAPGVGELDIGVPTLEVELLGAGLPGGRVSGVGGAVAVPDEHQLLGPGLPSWSHPFSSFRLLRGTHGDGSSRSPSPVVTTSV